MLKLHFIWTGCIQKLMFGLQIVSAVHWSWLYVSSECAIASEANFVLFKETEGCATQLSQQLYCAQCTTSLLRPRVHCCHVATASLQQHQTRYTWSWMYMSMTQSIQWARALSHQTCLHVNVPQLSYNSCASWHTPQTDTSHPHNEGTVQAGSRLPHHSRFAACFAETSFL